MPPLAQQIVWLFVLAVPIACVAWTVTHEEVFREPREYCQHKSRSAPRPLARKFFYLFTCEYCFSHYVTILFIALTGYQLLLPGWRGYLIAFFALVWVANAYMSLFSRLRVDIRAERAEADTRQKEVQKVAKETERIEKETQKIETELAAQDRPGGETRAWERGDRAEPGRWQEERRR